MNNIVLRCDFGERFRFNHVICNSNFSYEPELFPAALISKWNPAHVTLFPNGKVMLTGVKSIKEASKIIDKLHSFLHSDNAGVR